jgi:hypothetical protein
MTKWPEALDESYTASSTSGFMLFPQNRHHERPLISIVEIFTAGAKQPVELAFQPLYDQSSMTTLEGLESDSVITA